MNRLEERLRDAYQAAADTVTREMGEPVLTGTERPAGRFRLGSRAPVTRLAAPFAAAAAVAAIALAMSLIGTSGTGPEPGHPPGQARWGLTAVTSVGQGFPGGKIPAAARPKFYVGIQPSPGGPTEYAFTAYVYSTATGRRTGQLRLPRTDLWARAAARLGTGAYLVAATKDWPHSGCRSWLYQFGLTAAGQPTGLKPFVVPQVSGWATQLTGSGDGRVAVVTTNTCGRGGKQFTSVRHDRSTAISLPSGAATSWSPWPPGSGLVPEGLVTAMSADGRLTAFVAIAGQPRGFGLNAEAAYVMRNRLVNGPAARRYRLVVNPPGPAGAIAAALSPNARVTFVMTAHSDGGRWHEMIGAYATATGKLISVLASSSGRYLNGDGYMLPDPTGRYLLLMGFGGSNTAVLDIATHQLSVLHVRYPNPPLGATW